MKVMGANGLMVQPDSRAAVSTTKEPLALQPAAGFYHEKMPRDTEHDSPGRRRPIRTPSASAGPFGPSLALRVRITVRGGQTTPAGLSLDELLGVEEGGGCSIRGVDGGSRRV